MINIEKELDVAKKASEIAAALLKNYKNDLNEILSDEGRDVKLKADLESEKLIKEYLLLNFLQNYLTPLDREKNQHP